MAKHLNQITNKIKGYLSKGSSQTLHTNQKTLSSSKQTSNKKSVLPDALKLAILRGEARMRMQFFEFFSQKGFDDVFALQAYQKVYVDSNAIVEFVQNLGLINTTEGYIRSGVASQTSDYRQLCYELYCLLIDHLYQHGETQLFDDATIGLLQHYVPSLFPKQANRKPSLEQLKKQLKIRLNKHFNTQVTVKESFTTTQNTTTKATANFKLIAHMAGCYPLQLIQIEDKRLRGARFKAYHGLLEQLEAGIFMAKADKKMARKKDKIMPFA